MRTNVVQVGNSRGIRIPKVMLEQAGLKDEVDLEVRDKQIVIRAVKKPRHDWDTKFRIMAERGDDKPIDSEVTGLTSWDEENWQWK